MKNSHQDLFNVRNRSWATVCAALGFCFLITGVSRGQIEKSPASDKDSLGYPNDTAKALELGQTDARRDLSKDVMIVKTAGRPALHRGEYEQLLKERCNVRLQPIAGCIVSEGLLTYLSGYNEVSKAAIEQKFGTNILNSFQKEAEARWEERRVMAESPADSDMHSVRSGDTLTKIARAHGVAVRDLERANPGINPMRLQVGQRIAVPKAKQP